VIVPSFVCAVVPPQSLQPRLGNQDGMNKYVTLHEQIVDFLYVLRINAYILLVQMFWRSKESIMPSFPNKAVCLINLPTCLSNQTRAIRGWRGSLGANVVAAPWLGTAEWQKLRFSGVLSRHSADTGSPGSLRPYAVRRASKSASVLLLPPSENTLAVVVTSESPSDRTNRSRSGLRRTCFCNEERKQRSLGEIVTT
jgi:hypothetical protein